MDLSVRARLWVVRLIESRLIGIERRGSMDKEHTRYGAGRVVISRAENGYIVTLRLWDNEVTLVSETFDGVVGILRRVDWSGERLEKRLGGIGAQSETRPTPSADEAVGLSARSLRG